MTLVELLVGMAIMGVLTAMLLMGWFALSQSWGFTTKSADARDSGRQAMQRLQREIRDAQKPPEGYPTLGAGASDAPDAIIYRARPYSIAFSTTFNELGNDTAVWSHRLQLPLQLPRPAVLTSSSIGCTATASCGASRTVISTAASVLPWETKIPTPWLTSSHPTT